MNELKDWVYFAVDGVFQNQTSKQVGETLALVNVHACFYVKFVKSDYGIMHQLNKVFDLSY